MTTRRFGLLALAWLQGCLFSMGSPVDFRVRLGPAAQWRFAFASCHDYIPENFTSSGTSAGVEHFDWSVVSNRTPDALIWGGDIVYGDFPKQMGWLPWPLTLFLPEVPTSSPPFQSATGEKLRQLYGALKSDAAYADLLNGLGGGNPCPGCHYGTWDDHDFGLNDGDRNFPHREASKEAFLVFFDAPPSDPRRKRGGVYSSTLFTQNDQEGANNGEYGGVLVIALDLRYFKDPYDQPNGDFMGEEQWQWLDATLKGSNARAHVFVSSIQLLVEGRASVGEFWEDFPHSRERFLRLLAEHRVKAPLIVSGDVHFAEVAVAHCGGVGDEIAAAGDSAKPSQLVELTTSGLTHAWGVGMGHVRPQMQSIIATVFWAFQIFYPWNYQTRTNEKADFYLLPNFGELQFDFAAGKEPSVQARVLNGRNGDVAIEKTYKLRDLDSAPALADYSSSQCRPHRGESSALRRMLGWALTACVALALLAWKPLVAALSLWGFMRWLRRSLRQQKGSTHKAHESNTRGKPKIG